MTTLAWRSGVARQEPYIPGALSILQGTVPGRVRGPGHMVPTYFRRCSGIECFNGHCGFALFFFACLLLAGRFCCRRVIVPSRRSPLRVTAAKNDLQMSATKAELRANAL